MRRRGIASRPSPGCHAGLPTALGAGYTAAWGRRVSCVLHTREEWQTRHRALGEAMARLVPQYATPEVGRGPDLGARTGVLTDILLDGTWLEWRAVEPAVEPGRLSPSGRGALEQGWAHRIPYPDGHSDCVVFANV